ncbi:IS607-like element ISTko1 family transposase [Thermus thalpophilus]
MSPLLLTAHQVRERYGIHRNTLYAWERQGILHPIRTPGGRRRYRREEIERLLSLGLEIPQEKPKPSTVLYARVSTRKQEGFLKNQIARLEAFAKERGWDYQVIAEIASGVNEERRGLSQILNRAKKGELERVVVAYEDRLARFGVGYIRRFLEAFGVEVVVLNGEEGGDVQEELAQDLVAIVSRFAARVYGKRGAASRARRRKDAQGQER